jgi:hypothetical protein
MEAAGRLGSLSRRIGVFAFVVAIALASAGCGASIDRGKVIFTTTVPTADSNCQPANQITTASAATSVYATYVFNAKPGSETESIQINKDGQSFLPKVDLPTTSSQGLDCFGDTTDLSKLPGWAAGSFSFTVTANGSTTASGTLTVN